jgi:hypothetical protein
MSDTQHTAGPFWVAKAEDSARFDYAVGAADAEIAHVAERSDAMLFKAAPAMLAALESALDAWRDQFEATDDSDLRISGPDFIDWFGTWRESAVAAVAVAKAAR